MKFTKFWALLLALCLAVGMLPVSVFAAGETSGDWENIHREFDTASATLTITGEGDMPDGSNNSQRPYDSFRDSIKNENMGVQFQAIDKTQDEYKITHQVVEVIGDALFADKYGMTYSQRLPLISFKIDEGAAKYIKLAINGKLVKQGYDSIIDLSEVTGKEEYATLHYTTYEITEQDGNTVISLIDDFYLNQTVYDSDEGKYVPNMDGETEFTFIFEDGAATVTVPVYRLQGNYTVNNDNDFKWNYNSNTNFEVRTNAFNNIPENVYIDNMLVPADNYTVKAESGTVAINASYMKTLAYGEHSLVLIFDDGDAECYFACWYGENYANKLLDDNGFQWIHGSDEDITIHIGVSADEFVGLYSNFYGFASGHPDPGFIDRSEYTVTKGENDTTVITIPADYFAYGEKTNQPNYLRKTTYMAAWWFTPVFRNGDLFIPVSSAYNVLEGKNVVWDPEDGQDVTIKIDLAPIIYSNPLYSASIESIEIDNERNSLSTDKYTIDGNTITLHKEFLQTLSSGKHELSIFINDSPGGYAYTTLTVIGTSGDLTGDGEMDTRDATRLVQHLSNWDAELMGSADFNNDGAVDTRDATRLIQYLSGWEVKLY